MLHWQFEHALSVCIPFREQNEAGTADGKSSLLCRQDKGQVSLSPVLP